jgi:hypothetical protein
MGISRMARATGSRRLSKCTSGTVTSLPDDCKKISTHLHPRHLDFRGLGPSSACSGFDPERTRLHGTWDRQRIIKGIRAKQDQNLPLFTKYAMRNHSKLFSRALAKYGSWNKALVAASITEISRKTRLALLRELRDAVETS